MALIDGILAYWNLNDDGSGGVSLVDSTGNGNTLTNNGGVTLGTGIIGGDAVFNGSDYLTLSGSPVTTGNFSLSLWFNSTQLGDGGYRGMVCGSFDGATSTGGWRIWTDGGGGTLFFDRVDDSGYSYASSSNSYDDGAWHNAILTYDGSVALVYVDGAVVISIPTIFSTYGNYNFELGFSFDEFAIGQQDETGLWNRALSQAEVTSLYNGGAGLTYPFAQTPTSTLYYNNAENDGDWGNLLNWWQDSGFTVQATVLPTATNPINLYNQVTQNTQGADQCFCASASFWSANFGVGLTLQASGVVNMQGTSILAGTTTDGVSMHDSSQLAATSVVDGNVTMRDSSRAFGTILGYANVYYDGGNGQLPIGGTVNVYVNYLEWGYIAPCPPSSGGHNAIISRLLHLPWFINV